MIKKEDLNKAEDKIYEALAGIVIDSKTIESIEEEFNKLRNKLLNEYCLLPIYANIDSLELKIQNKCDIDFGKDFENLRKKISDICDDNEHKVDNKTPRLF